MKRHMRHLTIMTFFFCLFFYKWTWYAICTADSDIQQWSTMWSEWHQQTVRAYYYPNLKLCRVIWWNKHSAEDKELGGMLTTTTSLNTRDAPIVISIIVLVSTQFQNLANSRWQYRGFIGVCFSFVVMVHPGKGNKYTFLQKIAELSQSVSPSLYCLWKCTNSIIKFKKHTLKSPSFMWYRFSFFFF